MSKEELYRIIECYGDAARRAQQAGIDMVEVHCAHSYLVSTFISQRTNNRTDEFGGCFENRMRLPRLIIENIRSAKKLSAEEHTDGAAVVDKSRKALLKNLALFVLGAACLVVGSNLLVDNGTVLAQLLGVSERIIAVTMVAIGTSLPELVTAITAIVKKQSSMSVGNILGANIIDITIILPLCALISGDGLHIAEQSVQQTVYLDMPMCALVAAIAVIPTILHKRFTKLQGIFLLALYIAYVFVTVRI